MAVEKRGHIKIARKAFADDKWWKAKRVFSKWEAFVDMIQLAQWEPRDFVTTKFGTIHLERGEFLLSQRKMAQRWGWGRQSVRTFVESAEFKSRIRAKNTHAPHTQPPLQSTQRITHPGTVYLIINYDLYQSTETEVTQPATRQVTQDQPRSNPRTSSKALTTTTSASHEADNGSANGTAPSDSKPPNWAAEGAGIWNEHVGPITIGKFGRIMKPMVDKHGWNDSKAAEICFIELKAGQPRQLQWLVDESVTWVRLAKMPSVDPSTGAFTERGEMARRAALRSA